MINADTSHDGSEQGQKALHAEWKRTHGNFQVAEADLCKYAADDTLTFDVVRTLVKARQEYAQACVEADRVTRLQLPENEIGMALNKIAGNPIMAPQANVWEAALQSIESGDYTVAIKALRDEAQFRRDQLEEYEAMMTTGDFEGTTERGVKFAIPIVEKQAHGYEQAAALLQRFKRLSSTRS